MNLMFWKASKPKRVTQAVNRYLISEYGLGPELLAKYSMLEKSGKFSNRSVKMVRVFDPELLSTGETSDQRFDDLKGTPNEGALRFEGRFEKDGTIFLSDRRKREVSSVADTR